MDLLYYLAAWKTPRVSSNGAAKKAFHGGEKTIGSSEDIARLRSNLLGVLGPDANLVVDHGLLGEDEINVDLGLALVLEVPESRLRDKSREVLDAVEDAGYLLYDPQVGRLVVPMTSMVAPWPPEWTEPVAELRDALATYATVRDGTPESGEFDVSAFTHQLSADTGREVWQVGDPRPPEIEKRSHVAPELEALIPAGLVGSERQPMSVRVTDWGAPAVNRALKTLGVRPRDAVVVTALGGTGREVHSVTIFGVLGIAADELEAAFEPAIFKPRGVKWQQRDMEGRLVWWAEAKGALQGEDFNAAWWTRSGLVIWITGQPRWLESAVSQLP